MFGPSGSGSVGLDDEEGGGRELLAELVSIMACSAHEPRGINCEKTEEEAEE